MDAKISLIKPVSDSVYFALDESQIRFFATVGINFCLSLTTAQFITMKYYYDSPKEDPADEG